MSPQDEDRALARRLHEAGRVDLATLQAALRGLAPGQRLGPALVARGLLRPDELAPGARAGAPAGPAAPAPEGAAHADSTRTAALPSFHPPAGASRAQAWRPGERIGRWVLREQLGAGGMGVVFLAEDPETGARVAVKTILPEAAGEAAVARFRREGEAQARADAHPNVLRVRDAGEVGGRLYLVTDLAPGGDLEARLRQGPLPCDEAARVVAQLARGLAHVHARGILHRDLKPSNVLFDAEGTPMLVDFGLARIEGQQRLTRTGHLLGTPSYMAPEQADTSGAEDPRTDVYGLGAVLYHALAGRPPFVGPSVIDVIRQVMERPPEPPRRLRPEVPPALEAVCLRCLAKDPAARVPSAEALADALEAVAHGEDPDLPPAPPRRPRGVLALGAVLALAVGVTAAGLLALGPRPPAPAPSPAPATPPAEPPAPAAPPTARPCWAPPVDAPLTYALGIEDTGHGRARLEFAFTLTRRATPAASGALLLEGRFTEQRRFELFVHDWSDLDLAEVDVHWPRRAAGAFELELDPATGHVREVRGLAPLHAAAVAHLNAQERPWVSFGYDPLKQERNPAGLSLRSLIQLLLDREGRLRLGLDALFAAAAPGTPWRLVETKGATTATLEASPRLPLLPTLAEAKDYRAAERVRAEGRCTFDAVGLVEGVLSQRLDVGAARSYPVGQTWTLRREGP